MSSRRLIAGVLAGLSIGACSGGDPGGGSQPSGNPGDPPAASASPAADAAPPPPNDPPDLGTFVANPVDAFTGAAPYVSAPTTIRANDQHGGTSVTGKPCLSCHDGVTCTKFDFAGTVWKGPDKTQGAADTEIRIIDATSYAHSVHSDADGNFWHRATKDLPLPALSGARTATFKAIGKLNGTSCNVCHQPTNTPPGRLFVD